jgi:uncharacterized protein (DUF2147 family)
MDAHDTVMPTKCRGKSKRGAAWHGAAAILAVAPLAQAQNAATAATGLWLVEDRNGVIAIERCASGDLCGRLVWFVPGPKDIDKPPFDGHNPDPALRGRPLCGLALMGGFKPTGAREWGGGWIYDPESGDTYHARMALEQDGRLRLRGYVGIPLFGETQTWTRSGPVAPCTPPQENRG